MIGLAALTVPVTASAQNPDCTIIVPLAPLTAAGLATPYELTATNPANGPCHELNPAQTAFVQATILDPATGNISVYNPLVIDHGTTAAVPPVVPIFPANAVVGIWFGYNGDNLTQQPQVGALADNSCVNGIPGSVFGQFSHCNAPAFFAAANMAIRAGKLTIPGLGTARSGRPCPSTRDFEVIDQDQSDNVTTTYLATAQGFAQDNANNRTLFALSGYRVLFADPKVLKNPSDEGLLDRSLDPALGCTPMTALDLADPGKLVTALALNELQAAAYQLSPVALVPANDPMVLVDGHINLTKLNAYRKGVDMAAVATVGEADPALYCANMRNAALSKLWQDRPYFIVAPSPSPADANSLFTFMVQRYAASYEILTCQAFLGLPAGVTLYTDANGVVINATRP
jgi:hypothetical protein